MNERNLHKILRNTVLSQNYYIFRINSKKKFSLCNVICFDRFDESSANKLILFFVILTYLLDFLNIFEVL